MLTHSTHWVKFLVSARPTTTPPRGHPMTVTMEYTLPANAADAMQYRVNKANRKAAKLGQAPYRLETEPAEPVRHSEPDGEIWWEQMALIRVIGEPPRIGDFEIAGVITMDSIAGMVPNITEGVLTPSEIEAIRLDDDGCDHCHTNRSRTKIFILKGADGRVVQIGSACVELYTGVNVIPVDNFHRKLREGIEDEIGLAVWGIRAYSITTVLAVAAHIIDRHGYVSARDADLNRTTSTGSLVRGIVGSPSSWIAMAPILAAADIPAADATLDWARKMPADTEYGAKVRTIVGQSVCSYESIGIVSSLVMSYRRHLERLAIDSLKVTSKHIGAKDTRHDFGTVQVLSIRFFDSYYGGSFLVKFVDDDGNLIVWRTKNTSVEPGQRFTLVARIKIHDEWQGAKQTVIIRPKMEFV